jgi:hypothetical protein
MARHGFSTLCALARRDRLRIELAQVERQLLALGFADPDAAPGPAPASPPARLIKPARLLQPRELARRDAGRHGAFRLGPDRPAWRPGEPVAGGAL